MKEIPIGSIVISTAGRDIDNKYIVIGIVDKDYVLVADGKGRTMQHPKKKRIKHLKETMIVCDIIADKIKAEHKVFDSEIFSILKKSM